MSLERQRRVLLTGATGFVGSRLLSRLNQNDNAIRTVSRQTPVAHTAIDWRQQDISADNADLSSLCQDCRYVIHLAGQVHDPGAGHDICEHANHQTTLRLAQSAADAGVERFIFLSSVKVHGEGQGISHSKVADAYTETDTPDPQEPYADSKWAAEKALAEVCNATAMTYTILRPPLVYGPGVRANFFKLMKLVRSGVPLPFKGIANRRSLIYVDNLCDAIVKALDSEIAANKTYLIQDACVSTAELVSCLAVAMKRDPRLFYLPHWLMSTVAGLTGQKKTLERLTGSLIVDDSKLRRELGWEPPIAMQDAIQETVDWFLENE